MKSGEEFDWKRIPFVLEVHGYKPGFSHVLLMFQLHAKGVCFAMDDFVFELLFRNM